LIICESFLNLREVSVKSLRLVLVNVGRDSGDTWCSLEEDPWNWTNENTNLHNKTTARVYHCVVHHISCFCQQFVSIILYVICYYIITYFRLTTLPFQIETNAKKIKWMFHLLYPTS